MPGLSLVEKHREVVVNHDTQPAADPLRASVPLPYHLTLYPYGVPVRFLTNSLDVSNTARVSWSEWTKRFDVPTVEIRCIVDLDSDVNEMCPQPPIMRAQGHLLTMTAGVDNFGCCDLLSAFGFCWISRAVAADEEYLRFFFLEAMVYSILSSKYLVFLHAACIASQGGGILLAGDSGAGKTSLAYACARSGWTFISDDASVLSHQGTDLVVMGDSRRFRFRDSAAYLFPELCGQPESRRPGRGKPTLELPTLSLGLHIATEARARNVVFLKRHADPGRAASLVRFRDIADMTNRLHNRVWPEELSAFERDEAVIQRLLALPAYELHYCRLEDAVNLLNGFCRQENA